MRKEKETNNFLSSFVFPILDTLPLQNKIHSPLSFGSLKHTLNIFKSQPPRSTFSPSLLKKTSSFLNTKGHWSFSFHISLCPIHLFFLSILLNLSYVYTHGPQFMHYFSEHMALKRWWHVSFFLFTWLSVRMNMKFAEVAATYLQFPLWHTRCAWLLCKSKA